MAGDAQFLYSGLRVRRMAPALAFYRKLGFRLLGKGTMEHGGEYVHLRFPGSWHRLELNFYPKGNRFFEPFRTGSEFDHFGFRAKDPEAWKRRALRAGGTLAAEFVEGTTRLVYIRDPDGNWIEAFGPAHPRRRRKRA
ncbi:MAG TPA: VOC family protein [Thermoplasmata archaeon]|jgi:catechol 2,3-dioxygenase-like lactoylglutathione lyase family enzyme|nr:VOC family protein [Thermoplasmata archaeon]